MNKKNRFSMLEVKSDADAQKKETVSPPPTAEKKAARHVEKSIEVIVKKEDFQDNIRNFNLNKEVLDIHHKKERIQSKIFYMKLDAWIKIILGIFIVIIAAKKYIFGTQTETRVGIDSFGNDVYEVTKTSHSLNQNDYILIALIIVFIYYMFFKKKKKDN